MEQKNKKSTGQVTCRSVLKSYKQMIVFSLLFLFVQLNIPFYIYFELTHCIFSHRPTEIGHRLIVLVSHPFCIQLQN